MDKPLIPRLITKRDAAKLTGHTVKQVTTLQAKGLYPSSVTCRLPSEPELLNRIEVELYASLRASDATEGRIRRAVDNMLKARPALSARAESRMVEELGASA